MRVSRRAGAERSRKLVRRLSRRRAQANAYPCDGTITRTYSCGCSYTYTCGYTHTYPVPHTKSFPYPCRHACPNPGTDTRSIAYA